MNNTTKNKYDYYFSLGYETKEQIDLFLKNNQINKETLVSNKKFVEPKQKHDRSKITEQDNPVVIKMSSMALDSPIEKYITSGISSANGTHFAENPTSDPLIIVVNTTLNATVLNKFQIDFNVNNLPPFQYGSFNQYNPDDIDISVRFEHIDSGGGTTFLSVNAYFGQEYTRNPFSAYDLHDPTHISSMYPYVTDIEHHPFISLPYDADKNPGGIVYDTPDGDLHYLTLDNSAPLWHARFAPPAIGIWIYTFFISIHSGDKLEYTGGGSFEVKESNNPGYVVASGRNFRFTRSQEIFFPIGCNSAFASVPVFNRAPYVMHTHVIDALAANNGNYMRIFLTYDKLGIERYDDDFTHPDWVVGNYDYGQDRAFDLDGVLEFAEQNGIYVQFVFEERIYFNPSMSQLDWGRNPYSPFIYENASHLGFMHDLETFNKYAPGLFWTDLNCIKYYKRKLRYIMARWGYSTNVFAFEFMNEANLSFWDIVSYGSNVDHPLADLMSWQKGFTDYNSTSPSYKAPGYLQVSDWVNKMISFCKNECYQGVNHMFTISAPASESNLPNYPYMVPPNSQYPRPDDFVNRMNIDFYTSHFYDTTRFTDYRINFLANRANYLYHNKPFLIGEYGLYEKTDNDLYISSLGWTYTSHFIAITHNNNLYDLADYHNALFASVLSGCAGAIVSWSDLCTVPWAVQLAYFKPLVKFLDGEDLNMDNCIAICNPCPINPNFTALEINGAIIPNNYIFNNLPDEIFNRKISATGYLNAGILDNTLVEVFALQYKKGLNKDKIIGWVKNRNNWWYNLPHTNDNVQQDGDLHFPCYNPNPTVYPVYDVEITITDVCNGFYRIDFYSVYPEYPLVSNSLTTENGGIIGTITATVNCNILTFKVPGALVVLKMNNGPCAPDYGFKATPLIRNWGYGILGARPNVSRGVGLQHNFGLQPFSVGDNSKLVAYGDPNTCELVIYTRNSVDEYDWIKVNLAINYNPAFLMNYYDCIIALGGHDKQIFYKGTDNHLQCAYPDGTGWGYANFGEVVDGDIGCAANGGRVFFRGGDGDLHFLLYDNIGGPWAWRHYNFTENVGAGYNQKPSPTTNFAVNETGSLLAYRSNDGKLAIIFEVSPWIYSYNWVSVNVGGKVRVNNAGNVVFYTNTSNKLCAYYWNGTAWQTMDINTADGAIIISGPFDIAYNSGIDNAQVYFQGSDGFVHVAFVLDGQWVVNHILCPPEPISRCCINPNALIRYNNGTVIYQGYNDSSWFYDNFRAYYYGKGDITE